SLCYLVLTHLSMFTYLFMISTLIVFFSFFHIFFFFFFFNDTATTEIYTLSLHDALPISSPRCRRSRGTWSGTPGRPGRSSSRTLDRKSTRLNSSHSQISYAVFCLKKKKKKKKKYKKTKKKYNNSMINKEFKLYDHSSI